MTTERESWNRAYYEAPEIFDAFCRAEDPDGRITRRLMTHAVLDESVALEIGCGTGRYTKEWAPIADRYVAIERSQAMLALARRRLAGGSSPPGLICANATRLPFAEGTFDRVIAGWVIVNLRARMRQAVLSEATRVLRPHRNAAIWLIENHGTGEFQALRGHRADVENARLASLVEDWGFEPVEVVETELRFPTDGEAIRVLGWLCGDRVRAELVHRPTARLTHHVVILRGPKSSGTR